MQILDGIAYAHQNGVIHRDLKPENLLFFDEDIFGDEMVRISDFGLGKRMDTASLTITKSYIGMGTAAYMPPEQYQDFKRADHRVDIYSLGKILYELLTGEIPLHIDTHHVKLPRGFGPDTVADFYEIVRSIISDVRIRKLILARLLSMGCSHNRWHVGTIFGQLLASIADEEETLMARDVLLADPYAAKWIKGYGGGGLFPVIKDGFPKNE